MKLEALRDTEKLLSIADQCELPVQRRLSMRLSSGEIPYPPRKNGSSPLLPCRAYISPRLFVQNLKDWIS